MPPIEPESPDADLVRLIQAGLDELGTPSTIAPSLASLAELLHAWAQQINLTGHRSPETIARRLVLDALALERCLPEAETLVDLGTGAGFPGLPIAIARPDTAVTLVESRERRVHFQRAAVRSLGLRRVEPLRGRAEEIAPRPNAVAVAQAMAAPDQVARWLVPWVAPGGLLVIPGAETPPAVGAVAGLEPAEIIEYRVPLDGPNRTLWVARKAE